MPIYEYRCQDCGSVAEMLIRQTVEKTAECPTCGSSHMDKLISVSHTGRTEDLGQGATCCGRVERCDSPPCGDGCCQRR